MEHVTWKLIVLGALVAMMGASTVLGAQQATPDLILSNGKIITVDDRFSIAQAVAVRGDRIVAVGTDQEITGLAGPNTRRLDLQGRAVVPGLIDNHAHYQEEGAYWQLELRLDGVESRQDALEMIQTQSYDLLLTDKNLPISSGLMLVAHVSSLQDPIPSIVISGDDDIESITDAFERGASDYMLKRSAILGICCPGFGPWSTAGSRLACSTR